MVHHAAAIGAAGTRVIGAFLFGYFVTVTQFTQQAVAFPTSLPFIAVDLLRLVLLCAFPALTLWLPGLMP